MAAKEREEVERTTKQKMQDDMNHLDRNNRQTNLKHLMEGYILQWMTKPNNEMSVNEQ